MPSISDTLRYRLKASGMTQIQIATASGVAQSIISRFLRGSVISMDNAEKLQSMLDSIDKRKARQAAREEAAAPANPAAVEETAGA